MRRIEVLELFTGCKKLRVKADIQLKSSCNLKAVVAQCHQSLLKKSYGLQVSERYSSQYFGKTFLIYLGERKLIQHIFIIDHLQYGCVVESNTSLATFWQHLLLAKRRFFSHSWAQLDKLWFLALSSLLLRHKQMYLFDNVLVSVKNM